MPAESEFETVDEANVANVGNVASAAVVKNATNATDATVLVITYSGRRAVCQNRKHLLRQFWRHISS